MKEIKMIAVQNASLQQHTAAHRAHAAGGLSDMSFGDVLRALNPLQYLPGVGTIYRAITGDKPPEAFSVMGSMLAGGLMGGPIGAAVSAVSSLVQHVSGIDLDEVVHHALVSVGTSIGMLDEPAAQTVAVAQVIPPSPAGSETAAEAMQVQAMPPPIMTVSIQPAPDVAPAQVQAGLAAYGRVLGHV